MQFRLRGIAQPEALAARAAALAARREGRRQEEHCRLTRRQVKTQFVILTGAATLFGLADQAHSQIHYAIAGPIRALADAALATVRGALDPAVFAEAFAAGRQVSLAEAFATILAPDHVGGVH